MNILRNPFLRPFVSGADFKRFVDWGSLAAASADQVNGIINYFSNEHANKVNAENVEKTNQMNLSIARENNALQERMNNENNAFAAKEAERAFNRESQWFEAWNDPSAQVARLRAAGLNPALAYGNGGAQVGSVSSSAASPHGSGISPSMPNLQAAHYEPFRFKDPSESVKAFAEAFAALGQAKKSGVETDILEKEKDDLLRKVHAEGDLAEIAAEMERRYADKKRSKELQNMDMTLMRGAYECFKLAKEGKLAEAQEAWTRAKEQTEKEVKNLRHEEFVRAQEENKFIDELMRAKIANIRSSTNSNNASAANHYAQARFTDSQNQELNNMMDYNIQIRRNQAQLSEADVKRVGATLYSEIEYLLAHFDNLTEKEAAELKQVKAAADMAKWNYDMRWVNWGLDTVERINNGANKWAPWAFSRTDNVLTTNDTLYDGSTMKTETRTSGYKPAWQK